MVPKQKGRWRKRTWWGREGEETRTQHLQPQIKKTTQGKKCLLHHHYHHHYFRFHFVFNAQQIKGLEWRATCVTVRMLDSGWGFPCRPIRRSPEDQPRPRCQLPLLKPKLQFWNWRPLKNNKGKPQLLHPNSSTKEKGQGGNRFHISHKHRTYCGSQECVSGRGLTMIAAQMEPWLKINTKNVQPSSFADTPTGKCWCLRISKRPF